MPAALLLASALSVVAAVPLELPPPTGMEATLIEDAQGGSLKRLSFLEAALLASGTPEARLKERAREIEAALKPVVERARRRKGARAQGTALLQGLHEQIFRRYVATQSNVSDVVATGEFNCVSSAVIFVVAAEGLLARPRAMLMPTHAYARVDVDGRPVNVETTTPAGFDADQKKLYTPEFLKRLGIDTGMDGRPVDVERARALAVELPALALVAAIYSNRAVDLMDRGDLRGAAVALDRGTRVAPGAQKARLAGYRGTLLVNAAADLLDQGRAQDAIPLLLLGLEGVGGDVAQSLRHNLTVAYVRRARQLSEQGALYEALAQLELGKAQKVKLPALDSELRRVTALLAAREGSDARCKGQKGETAAECFASVSNALLQKGDIDGAVANARAAGFSTINGRVMHWNALNARAQAASDRGDCVSAEVDFREAEAFRDVIKQDPVTFAKKAGGCWARASVTAHKAGRIDASEMAARRALLHLPGDKAMRHNLAAMQFNRALDHANAGRCDQARPLGVEALRYDDTMGPKVENLLAVCAYNRAISHWNRQEWERAAAEFRRGLRDAPGHAQLKDNLAKALYNLAVTRVRAKDCEEGLAVLEEAQRLGLSQPVDDVRASCR